ncbi:MAG: DNA polymerase Y family protein [Polyangiaceae bacterium]
MTFDSAPEPSGVHGSPEPLVAEAPRVSEAGLRRIAAVVLPELMLELAWDHFCTDTQRRGGKLTQGAGAKQQGSKLQGPKLPLLASGLPFAVVLLGDQELEGEVPATAQLAAVSKVAQRFGVRAGQTIAEACALVSNLIVQELVQRDVIEELERLAEVALGFGATVSYEAPDTVWVDVTGVAHLFALADLPPAAARDVHLQEEQLALQLADRVRQASAFEGGHTVRVAVADGPRVAQALARWGRLAREGVLVVRPEETKRKLAELPIVALPLDAERISWLSRLGLHSIADVARLPPSAASGRLGEQAKQILELCQGYDPEPLTPYRPPELPVEHSSWEDPIDGVEPLGFVLRGLVARLSSRLEGRGEAAQLLELVIHHDRSIARLRSVAPETLLRFELSAPLWREAELLRVVRSRLDHLKVAAPSLGLTLTAPVLTHAAPAQLDLARSLAVGGKARTSGSGPESLPVLLAELVADLGKERVGVLEVVDSHRPESRSRLTAVPGLKKGKRRSKKRRVEPVEQQQLLPCGNDVEVLELPSRLFSHPLALSNVQAPPHPIARIGGWAGGEGRAVRRSPPGPVRRRGDEQLEVGATLSFGRRLYAVTEVRFESRLDGVEWWTPHPVSRDYWRVTLETQSLKGQRESFDALVFVDRLKGGYYLQGIYD